MHPHLGIVIGCSPFLFLGGLALLSSREGLLAVIIGRFWQLLFPCSTRCASTEYIHMSKRLSTRQATDWTEQIDPSRVGGLMSQSASMRICVPWGQTVFPFSSFCRTPSGRRIGGGPNSGLAAPEIELIAAAAAATSAEPCRVVLARMGITGREATWERLWSMYRVVSRGRKFMPCLTHHVALSSPSLLLLRISFFGTILSTSARLDRMACDGFQCRPIPRVHS